MAHQRSEKSPYQSRYADSTWVTSAQYISELICEKKATYQKIELPFTFWNLPEWKRFFCSQVQVANKLLKIYTASAIIAALMDKRMYRVYSLNAPHLDAVIEEYQKKQAATEEKLLASPDIKIDDSIILSKPRKPRADTNKKSLMSRLREIDGEEKESSKKDS